MRQPKLPEPKSSAATVAAPNRGRVAAAPGAGDALDDDAGPADIDEFRWELCRRISTFLESWRNCPRPQCRRARACRNETGQCSGDQVLPPSTPEEQAAMLAEVQRALKQALPETDPAPGDARRRGR